MLAHGGDRYSRGEFYPFEATIESGASRRASKITAARMIRRQNFNDVAVIVTPRIT
jgi:hypothetical protein